ncbi:MAG TPA: glucoamylase family protein, partial [Rhizomicrobium sp.]|nr:glucoamylase family protein [Rhizomicrobium sp.]
MHVIRSELFSAERLEQHAESLAKAQAVTAKPPRRRPLPRKLNENADVLIETFRKIARAARDERSITPAGEWFLDNYHIVEEQIREIRRDLPPDFYRELPKLGEGPLAGYPRVYGISWALVAHTDSGFDAEQLRRFVTAYQRVQPLKIGELWALATTLRLTLVENLTRLALNISKRADEAIRADTIADRVMAAKSDDDGLLTDVERETGELSPAFVARLEQRLRDQSPLAIRLLHWIDERMVAAGTSTANLIRDEYQDQGGVNVTVRNVITSMRLVSGLDWTEFVESVSLVDRAFESGSDFRGLDFPTRDRYRAAVERIADGSGRSEISIAQSAVAMALAAAKAGKPERERDPGYYLIARGVRGFEQQVKYSSPPREALWRAILGTGLLGYLGAIFALAAIALFLLGHEILRDRVNFDVVVGLLLLGIFPATDLAMSIVNRAVTQRLGPAMLPAMALRTGLPESLGTMLVVPVLLAQEDGIEELVRRLEVHYLANPEPGLQFALLSDFPDHDSETAPGDDELLKTAESAIAALNIHHGVTPNGPRFLLLHRRRVWNPVQNKWMGWERKRGKLHELNRLLRGAKDTTFLSLGTVSTVPTNVKYVITLDADTRMPRGAAMKLIGKMAHPLNKPRIDPQCARVVEGHAILQPRVTPSLPVGAGGSMFQWAFSGPSGLDPYAFAVSDVYQDLFEEGSFVGKGIYDVDAFEAALKNRIPENTVLSHDLLEGIFGRAALASDIEVIEEFPSRYDVEVARQHRWVRGDWQLLPWIFARGRDLVGGRHRVSVPLLGRWKMLDNLRRSLTAPAILLSLLIAWTQHHYAALLWTAFILACLILPAFLPLLSALIPRRRRLVTFNYFRNVARDAALASVQIVFGLTFLARAASLSLDAICRTLFRLFISRRKLLEWVSFADTAYSNHADIRGFTIQMVFAVLFAVFAFGVTWIGGHGTWPIAAPFLALWALSPAIARGASRVPEADDHLRVSEDDRQGLRQVARRTWRFFDAFVTAEENFLPIDNFQEDPRPVSARRTSPTNIGGYVLSALAAHEFGWIGLNDLIERLEATMASLDKLERYRGHFLNWYSTENLEALHPRYVSSVDSGNLMGHLIAIKSACRDLRDRPLMAWPWFQGIEDNVRLLRETGHRSNDPAADRALNTALSQLESALQEKPQNLQELARKFVTIGQMVSAIEPAVRAIMPVARSPIEETEDLVIWAIALTADYASLERDFNDFLAWVAKYPQTDLDGVGILVNATVTLETLSKFRHAPGDTELRLNALESASTRATDTVARLQEMEARIGRMVDIMDFTFLFDTGRQLLSIGFAVDDQAMDPNCYDLLASEARLASFLAIAKGDAPTRHWFRLGRTLRPVGRGSALQSWSGSMFEYLMPTLLMHEPPGAVLAQSNRAAVRCQIEYAAERGVPWGISESEFYARDADQNYQYSAFGVPDLGIKRGLGENLVIAPYATGLATMIAPAEARKNYRRLTLTGARGRFGWYEALDYTRARLPEGSSVGIVRAFMAHHQGMTIIAISDVIHDGMMRDRFHAEPMVRASELLLHERMPRDVSVAQPPPELATGAITLYHAAPPAQRRFKTAHTATPRTQLLSNGHYTTMVTAAGSGYSQWNDLAITRWREDPTRDNWGTYFYLRDLRSNDVWSAGFQPRGVEPDSYDVIFSEDRAIITRQDGSLTTMTEVAVSPEDDAEVRRISITNHGSRLREIEVTSYAELVLTRPGDDMAHPAFMKMFVETEYVRQPGALLATRRRRGSNDPQVWAAHISVVEGESVGEPQFETDRGRFLTRNQSSRMPGVIQEGWPLSNTTGAVLDPIFSLRRRVRIPRGETVTIAFWTMAAATRDEVLDLADKHCEPASFARATTLAATQALAQLQHLGMTADNAHLYQAIANAVLYCDIAFRAPPDVIARGLKPAPLLWSQGISGDLPIILLTIDHTDDIDIARELVRAHEYWRQKHLAVDLVILNERAASYAQDLHGALENLVRINSDRAGAGASGNVFLVRNDLISPELRDALRAVARVCFSSRQGPLADQVERALDSEEAPRAFPRIRKAPPLPAETLPPPPQVDYFNTLGGFSKDGREYITVLEGTATTPAPWSNVVANPSFGFLGSGDHSGFTWALNSQQNQITAWSNDPVANEPVEVFYIRDLDTGEVWTPTAAPIRSRSSRYTIRHGQGYTTYEHQSHGIAAELTQFVPLSDPLKISRLKLVNKSTRARRLAITAYVEWTLGASRVTAPFIVTGRDEQTSALYARNPRSVDFSERVAFLDMGGRAVSSTCDRREFLGRDGCLDRPLAFAYNAMLSGAAGAGLDPCAVLSTEVRLAPNAEDSVVVLMGQGANEPDAAALIAKYRATTPESVLAEVQKFWDDTLGGIEVKTPDKSMDLMLNRWLQYQALSCRIWGR